MKKWNWQFENWPNFVYDPSSVYELEKKFLQGLGGVFAILKHFDEDKKKIFIIESLLSEGLSNAKIEGEILQRSSLQYSIQRHFDLKPTKHSIQIPPKEKAMGDLLWEMYTTFDKPLTHKMLYKWHEILMDDNEKIEEKGQYRSSNEPMQIVSNRLDSYQIYYEAPPSNQVFFEMERFIKWFNQVDFQNNHGEKNILIKASIAHLYFEAIHPFEDGNGRIGRALVEKILSMELSNPTLIAVSQMIEKNKKKYYQFLGECNTTLHIQNWVVFFSSLILEAQEYSLKMIHFLSSKAEILSQLSGQINSRQMKVLLKMFDAGLEGFKGGA